MKGGFEAAFQKTEVTIIEKKLTAREKSFCRAFAATGDGALAAKRSGYENEPEQNSERLLSSEAVVQEIERLADSRERLFKALAAIGYQRLAFGNISDAVSLLFMENPSPRELSKMDLFLVSEIKKPKDGAMEIKFFDRLKALEKLGECSEHSDGAQNLFDAIGKGADKIGSDGDD